MKKHLCKALLIVLASSVLLSAFAPVYIAAEELKYMAYNFYSNPDLSKTSGRFDSFMIDFRSDKAPLTTYWSLANFGMDLSSAKTRRTYPNISGFGAYCGLQNSSGRMGILSFWESVYKKNGEEFKLTATRVYPKGSSNFGGEGEGTNCIMPYEWENDKWYRMLLHSWEDEQTGTTFAGMWLLDVESGKWTLFSYFDTHLYDSYFTGSMSQFMENYWGLDVTTNCNVERTCNLKNMYVYDHAKKDWISLATSTLSYGDGGAINEDQKKYGAHSFGATEEYFWGSTGGKVEDQEAYEQAATKYSTHTVNQPEKPVLEGAPAVSEILVSKSAVQWNFAEESTPQLSYQIKLVDAEGKTVYSGSATRPEERKVSPEGITTKALKCILTITDVFGASATFEHETEEYKEATGEVPGESVAPSESDAPESIPSEQPSAPSLLPTVSEESKDQTEQNGKAEDKKPIVPIVIGAVCGGGAVVAAVAGVAIVVRKRKKNG